MNKTPPPALPRRPLSRRDFTRLGLGSAAALGAAALGGGTGIIARPAAAQQPASDLQSEYLMELLLDGEPLVDTGHYRIAPLAGGSFAGPRLRGEVLPGGADWITQVSGHSSLDVRITLLTDDGAHIYMTYRGIVKQDGSDTYWRITPSFHTAADQYDWLNHLVCVGKNKQVQGKIAYDVWRIL